MSDILIVGGGIIGAALAYRLSAAGRAVTVVDAGPLTTGATCASFGWINASFYLDHAHFNLRQDSIAAWHRLEENSGPLPIRWQGSLWWEEAGEGLHAFQRDLDALGYPAELLDRDGVAELEPAVGTPPEQAVFLPSEGAAESAEVALTLLARAAGLGAQICTGVRVSGLRMQGGRVTGVDTNLGPLEADTVVVAAGIGTQALVQGCGVDLPMLRRPGVTVTTQPVAPVLSHILVAPGQELRQLPDGRLLAPTSANHQEDETSEITEPLADLTRQTLARVQALLPEVEVRGQTTALTMRPVPGDGLPVIGPAGPDGLYVCVLHSGVTLAAGVAELAAREIAEGTPAPALAPYRITRFTA